MALAPLRPAGINFRSCRRPPRPTCIIAPVFRRQGLPVRPGATFSTYGSQTSRHDLPPGRISKSTGQRLLNSPSAIHTRSLLSLHFLLFPVFTKEAGSLGRVNIQGASLNAAKSKQVRRVLAPLH